MKTPVETRINEIRYTTGNPKKMLNRYLAKDLYRTWAEDFIDEDCGEVVSVPRREIILHRGTLLDVESLSKVEFHLQAGDINEVDITNQKRVAFEQQNTSMDPYIAQVTIGARKFKFLLYAFSVDSALLILKDYIELTHLDSFFVNMVKDFDNCIILTDTLKEIPLEGEEEVGSEKSEAEKEQSDRDKKFYQIECKISHDEHTVFDGLYVVHTINPEKAMTLINTHLKRRENQQKLRILKSGGDYADRDICATIETVKVLPVARFIPEEFSMAYAPLPF